MIEGWASVRRSWSCERLTNDFTELEIDIQLVGEAPRHVFIPA